MGNDLYNPEKRDAEIRRRNSTGEGFTWAEWEECFVLPQRHSAGFQHGGQEAPVAGDIDKEVPQAIP